MKKQLFTILTAAVFPIFIFCGCSSIEDKPVKFSFRFAVLGNTLPESPFVGFPGRVQETVSRINSENPLFVVHTGNVIHGGRSWMGIREEDVERQYALARSAFSGISSGFYTIAGETDIYENDLFFYKRNFRRNINFSFTCSRVRFIVFNTISGIGNPESDLKWLKSELDISGDFLFTVIFTHNSIFNDRGVQGIYTESEKFHELVKDSCVKIVISGNPVSSSGFTVDSVQYFIAGTGGYETTGSNRSLNRYYIFELTEETVEMKGVGILK